MSNPLRDYQVEMVEKIRALMQRGVRRILVQSPTGSGKTLLTAHMLGTAASKGLRCLFSVHRRELIKQSTLAFEGEGIHHGIIASGFPEDKRQLVQIASIQTLGKRLATTQIPKLVVFDEAHHQAASTWSKISDLYKDSYIIGLTATPCRLDGKGLGDHYDEMVEGPSVNWLIEHGYLSKYRMFAPATPDVSHIATRMGDFINKELEAAIDRPTITGDAIREYKKRALGKRAVVFCVSIEHSKHVAQSFANENIKAVHVDGETDTRLRDEYVSRFRSGDITVLCNVDLFGEGFDLPILEVAVLLRPTQSLGLYLQACGRALRPSPGKEHALILDHAGNCSRHGLPDEDRVWSLDGIEKKNCKSERSLSVKICPKCSAAQVAGRDCCIHCGFTFEVQSREVAHVEGELIELDPKLAYRHRMMEQGKADSLEDLINVGKARGYRNPWGWAKQVWNARQRKKLANGM